jgi:hypothetical protein
MALGWREATKAKPIVSAPSWVTNGAFQSPPLTSEVFKLHVFIEFVTVKNQRFPSCFMWEYCRISEVYFKQSWMHTQTFNGRTYWKIVFAFFSAKLVVKDKQDHCK